MLPGGFGRLAIPIDFPTQQHCIGSTLMYAIGHLLTGFFVRENMLGNGQGVTGIMPAGAHK